MNRGQRGKNAMHNAIFLSDFHLGSRLAKAEQLLDFIESHEAKVWYLVGDIYDIKRLRRRRYWPAAHGRVIRALRRKARAGAGAGVRVVYVPGNHDPELRGRPGARPHLPGIEVRPQILHQTAQGRTLLVVHGDQHGPPLVLGDRPLTYVGGCTAYLAGVGASEMIGRSRARLGLDYWSLSAALKDRVMPRVPLMARYRDSLREAARAEGADGVVCGHIHHAAAEVVDGVLYINCGDWVDSCTALVESGDGCLDLVRWTGPARHAPAHAAARRVALTRPVESAQALTLG